jgi:predicted alpha/beta hydrolase family esterase
MKFVILHGTSASHESNWFPWLKQELENLGHEVWSPDLPDAERPNIQKYNHYLLNSNFDFEGSVVIGHSSGAVAILGLLDALPKNIVIDTAVFVGAFTKRLSESPSWEMLRELFEEPFDYETIKLKANKFIFIHSDDDPYCPIEQAEFLSKKLDGEMVRFTGMGHFSKRLDPRFNKFPELLEIIKEKIIK